MLDNISLDQVRTDGTYDFVSRYEANNEDVGDDFDSPFSSCNVENEYLETDQFCNKMKESQNSISYFHLNCRGLSANWESFKDLIQDLQGDNFSFDFVGISEVFKCDLDGRLKLPGFQNIITRCRESGSRGGVGLFIKDNINFKIRDDLSTFIPHVYESLFIEISTSSKNNIVGVIYRPNTQPRADLEVFSQTLYDTMEQINSEHKYSVIMGDVNIDLLKYGEHKKTNDYIDNIFARGFMPCIFKPTRITQSTATLIDHIYTNNILHKSTSGIIITDVADHFGIFHIVTQKRTQSKITERTKRAYTDTNISKFKHYLEQTNFEQIFDINCTEKAFDTFMTLYMEAFEKAFPETSIKINKKFIKRDPWVTNGLLTSSRTKAKMLHKKLKIPNDRNIQSYKIFVRIYNKLKRTLKINYFSQILDANKSNSKKTWSILKQAIGKNNDKSSFPQSFSIDNENISDKGKIAEAFNNFFGKIGKSTSENVPTTNKKYTDYLVNSISQSMFLEPIESHVVLSVASKLKPKLSSGHDHISTKLLKETIELIHRPLTYLINKSFTTGIVPSQLKIAKVIPIYKNSETNQLKNYRPVSLLPAISKVFEKIMYNKVMGFLDSNNILYKHQYGFRAKHSTIHPILHLINHCADANNKTPKEHTLSIFCDLSKAFDVIDHSILLKKLHFYGLRGIVNDWFRNYLTGRKQYVEIENTKSDTWQIECGVPQGSILGPLLYLIYVNDISMSTNEKILSFADDFFISV